MIVITGVQLLGLILITAGISGITGAFIGHLSGSQDGESK